MGGRRAPPTLLEFAVIFGSGALNVEAGALKVPRFCPFLSLSNRSGCLDTKSFLANLRVPLAAALDSYLRAEMIFLSYETPIPTVQDSSEASTRLPRAQQDHSWRGYHRPPPSRGPQAAHARLTG